MALSREKTSAFGAAVMEMLFPQHCAMCGKETPDSLCRDCFSAAFHPIERACVRCGREMSTEYDSPDCAECHGEKYSFKTAVSIFSYKDPGRALFLAAKFGGEKPSLGAAIAKSSAGYLTRDDGAGFASSSPGAALALETLKLMDYVTEVPVIRPFGVWDVLKSPIEIIKPGAKRPQVNRRTYNFSAVFAHFSARSLGLTHIPGALRKVRDIPSQVGLSLQERKLNVRDAFAPGASTRGKLEGANVLLVDDLFTTGATASECALTLKRAGAKMVVVLTLFSTPPKPEARMEASYILPNFDDESVPPPIRHGFD